MDFKHLHNTCTGTCVIVGNGPSLRNVPDEWLAKYPTIGSNRIYLRFTPSFFVCVNPLVMEQFSGEIAQIKAPRFTPWEVDYQLTSMPTPLFSYAPYLYIYEGHTVTFVAMQLAFFMGFTRVKLLGVDHRYVFTGNPNELAEARGDDPNHFDPTYFSNVLWNNPDLEKSTMAYQLAKRAFEDNGRIIVNCTEGTSLDVFPQEAFS